MLRISRAKPVASPPDASNNGRQTPPAWRGPVRLLAPGALVATIAFACHDRDAIWILDPNAAGSGGQAGIGASGGSGGNGGSAGAAGAAGTMGGTSGSGGVAGAGGSGGVAGTAGTAGTGGTLNDPDGGVDGGDPDSGGPPPAPTQAEIAAAICVQLDNVPSCPAPAEPCADGQIGGWDFIKSSFPAACATDIDAYFGCVGTAADATFDCAGDNTPEIAPAQTGSCADEEATYYGIFDNSNPCNPP